MMKWLNFFQFYYIIETTTAVKLLLFCFIIGHVHEKLISYYFTISV